MKKCKICQQEKTLAEFTTHAQCKQGARPECKACERILKKARYQKNSAAIIASTSIWARNNKDKRSVITKRYYYKNLEAERQRGLDYAKNNPSVKQAQCARRRAALDTRTPKWLTKLEHDHIKLFYEASVFMSSLGAKHEVDHIIPLHGKNVSGLHVPWNLQVIPMENNRSKSNKLVPNSPNPTLAQ